MTTFQEEDPVESPGREELMGSVTDEAERPTHPTQQDKAGMVPTKDGRRTTRQQPTPNLLCVEAPLFLLALAMAGWALAIGSPMFSAAIQHLLESVG